MYLTGISDEAATGIDCQIKATQELGWKFIEARNIDGINIVDISEVQFDIVQSKLDNSGIRVNCFASAIANWAKQITDPHEKSFDEAKRAIPRMRRLGTKLIRIMSYAVLDGHGPDDQMEQQRFKKLREIKKMFDDAAITVVHENCMNYGGMGWQYTLRLLENVPGLKLVFDTGNPVFNSNRKEPEPCPKQSSWEFYQNVKPHIQYVHIKDGIWNEKEKKSTFTFPGDGDGNVFKIVKDLLDNGYDGGFSIEPHMSVVFHDDSVTASECIRYADYIEYGRRFEKLIEKTRIII